MPLDHPAFVVGLLEVEQCQPELLDCPEGPDPEEVLLERSDEALGAAVALGGADEGGGGRGSEPGDLPLEVAGHVLAAVVVSDAQAPAASFSTPPKRSVTPCRIGSSASWRVPWRAE